MYDVANIVIYLQQIYRYLTVGKLIAFVYVIRMHHMIAPDNSPSIPDFLFEVGLNLALGLVTFCCGCKTACWGPTCC